MIPPPGQGAQRHTMNGVWRCALLILWVAASPLRPQGIIQVGSVDTSAYPIIHAEIRFPDVGNLYACGTGTSGLRLQENGVDCPILDLWCPPRAAVSPLSSLILIDRSTSMSEWDPGFQLLRAAAGFWLDALGADQSECAISLFDASPRLAHDFTHSSRELRAVVDSFRTGLDATSYQTAFLDPRFGAVPLLRQRSGRRLVLLLTDGGGWGSEESIVRGAEEAGVTICALVAGRDAGDFLRRVTARTGGGCVDRITTLDEMRCAIFSIITEYAGRPACRIVWESSPDCSRHRTVTISCPSGNATVTFVYSAPIDSAGGLRADPELVDVGDVELASYRDTTVPFMLQNIGGEAITVHAVSLQGDGGQTFAVDVGRLPFRLAPGERRSVRLRFSPEAIGESVARLVIDHNGSCRRTTLRLQGEGVGGAVRIPSLRAPPGDRLYIPLLSDVPRVRGNTRQSKPFRATLRFNSRLLIIDDASVRDISGADTGRRTLVIEGRWDLSSDTLVQIMATAALADTTATPLEILDFRWLDSNRLPIAGEVARHHGLFTLDGICRENGIGGARLVRDVGDAWLRLVPTFSAATPPQMLEFRSIEDGRVVITLDDRRGRRVATLFDGVVQAGDPQRIPISIEQLPSGMYRCTMQTPTQRMGIWLAVVR